MVSTLSEGGGSEMRVKTGSGWVEVQPPSPLRAVGPGKGEPEPAEMSGGAVTSKWSLMWGWGESGWVVSRSGSASLRGRDGVAGWAGRDLLGVGVRRPLKVPLEGGGPGKNCVCSGERPHVAWIAGQRI